MGRFHRMLSRDPKILVFVHKNDGTWAASKKDGVLLNIHFPNCVSTADTFCNAGIYILHKYLVDVYRDCLRWCNIPDGWKGVVVVFISNPITSALRIIDRYRGLSHTCWVID